MVDTLGLVWGVLVVSGQCSEAEGAKQLLGTVKAELSRLAVLWLDGGFEHRIEDWVAEHCAFRVQIVKRSEGKKGWELLPKRWVVERTFGWFGNYRRLLFDLEFKPTNSEGMLWLATVNIMLRRLWVDETS